MCSGTRAKSLALLTVALSSSALLAGCGGGGGSGGSPSSQQAGVTGGSAATVKAEESEFKITLSPSSLLPGTYTFVAENKGQIDHALEIQGPGVEGAKTGTIAPGASQELTVTLQPGKYELYCPIGGHKAQGMDLQLQVGAAGGVTTTKTKTTGGGY